MAEKVLYGHASGDAGTGYRVLARSPSTSTLSEMEVDEFVQRLKLRPADLGDRTGWFWLPLHEALRVFTHAQVHIHRSGVQTLELRLLILHTSDCERIQWQPFRFQDEMLDAVCWEIDASGALPGLRVLTDPPACTGGESDARAFSLPWKAAGTNAAAICAAFTDACRIESRKGIRFLAPDMSDRNSPRISFQTNVQPKGKAAMSRAQSAPSVMRRKYWILIAAAIVVSSLITYLTCSQRIAITEGKLRDRELALSKLENNQPSIGKGAANTVAVTSDPPDTLAKETLDQLRKLHEELYRGMDSSQAVQQDNERLLHYLRNENGSDDYVRLLENALRKWTSLERTRTTHLARRTQQGIVVQDLKNDLADLKSLVDELQRKPLPETDEAKLRQDIEELLTQIRNVLSRLEPLESDDSAGQSLPP